MKTEIPPDLLVLSGQCDYHWIFINDSLIVRQREGSVEITIVYFVTFVHDVKKDAVISPWVTNFSLLYTSNCVCDVSISLKYIMS